MRLTDAKIQSLSNQLLAALEALPQVTFKGTASQVGFTVKSIMTEDLRREDQLDEEVKRLLEHHLRGKSRMSIDYNTLFRKAKAQMIRERKLVI